MSNVRVGDTVQNAVQNAIVRWVGSIDDRAIVGLQLINTTLIGYTDGTCPLDQKRYFDCPIGQGYYVFAAALTDSYRITSKSHPCPERTVSPAPVSVSQPIPSLSSPSVSQIQHSSDKEPAISSPRGVLSRLASGRDQRRPPSFPAASSHPPSDDVHSSSASRVYRAENYGSTVCENSDITENPSSRAQIVSNSQTTEPLRRMPSFGHEYFLDGWTLRRVKSLLETEIAPDQQCCLNVLIDQSNVQQLVDEQITDYPPVRVAAPPVDVRIELVKIFDSVEIVFPSRRIRLYDNDYLLLAILCSNGECAYVRTVKGWIYTDDESGHGQPIVVEEISQMIDDLNTAVLYKSEQCLHALQQANFLYYKLVG